MAEEAEEPIVHLTVNGRRPRVAIVGGRRTGAMIAGILVEQFGCEPLHAPGAEDALALIRRDPAIDLILLDLSLPDMDGIVAAQLLRTLGARNTLPILALTDDRSRLAAPARPCRRALRRRGQALQPARASCRHGDRLRPQRRLRPGGRPRLSGRLRSRLRAGG